MGPIEKAIDEGVIHEGFTDYRARYAECVDLKTHETAHRVMVKKRGRGYKWSLMGSGEPFSYQSKEMALKDVKAFNEWVKSY